MVPKFKELIMQTEGGDKNMENWTIKQNIQQRCDHIWWRESGKFLGKSGIKLGSKWYMESP